MEGHSSCDEKESVVKPEGEIEHGFSATAIMEPQSSLEDTDGKQKGMQVVSSRREPAAVDSTDDKDSQQDTEVTADIKDQQDRDNCGSQTVLASEVLSPLSSNIETQSDVGATACYTGVEYSSKECNEKTAQDDMTNRTYYVKWITWKGVRTAIVTQNNNGPCPLLAIINILLLRRAIEFPSLQEMVTTAQLMEYLGDHVLKEVPENLAEGAQRNFEQNMQDAFSILPKLKTGLDVNVKFTGVADFEFTPECVVFDLLNIHLYHGWLVDPQNIEYKAAIAGLSYNQLVEKIVASKEENTESASEGLLAESFLQETANQLTYHGLCELNVKVKEDELCVFFRNNHFSTLYKQQNELFLLLTDQGFLTEDQLVWQTLSNVDGDGVFVDNTFKTLPMKEQPLAVHTVSSPGTLSQEDQDYMLALSIQQQDQPTQAEQPTPAEQPVQSNHETTEPPPPQQDQGNPNYNPSQQELFDLQFAMQLQEQENQINQPPPGAAAVGHQERRTNRRQTPPPEQRPSPPNQSRDGHSGKNCVLL